MRDLLRHDAFRLSNFGYEGGGCLHGGECRLRYHLCFEEVGCSWGMHDCLSFVDVSVELRSSESASLDQLDLRLLLDLDNRLENCGGRLLNEFLVDGSYSLCGFVEMLE